MSDFISHMPIALDEAKAAAGRDEVPVGAVVVDPSGHIIGRAGNETRARNDPTAHAEILAIRRACTALGSERLIGVLALGHAGTMPNVRRRNRIRPNRATLFWRVRS